uniref:Uncharacterized protein n=1 Tax=Oryza barthii TaxID=65489 RepID=A0A0D3FJC1_9ORYZ
MLLSVISLQNTIDLFAQVNGLSVGMSNGKTAPSLDLCKHVQRGEIRCCPGSLRW